MPSIRSSASSSRAGAETCPKCGSDRVRCSSSILVHLWRHFLGSRKRRCTACGERWCAPRLPDLPAFLRPREYVVILLSAAGVLAFLALAGMGYNPVRWFKTETCRYYDQKYGEEGKQKLWKHWGWLYGRLGGAIDDYDAHPTK
ncbi:MAG: hypothetical protein HY922_08550 [Elusimicrobia bacterium]|nr:hypothetical protein [Elusimicrobiota bacterium]